MFATVSEANLLHLVIKFAPHADVRLLHHAASALWAALVPLQLSRSLRVAYPAAHRWSGRVIALLAMPIMAGFVLIMRRGLTYDATFGGKVPVVFQVALYFVGVAFSAAAALTASHARARRIHKHRAWARRYVALGGWVAAQRVLVLLSVPVVSALSGGVLSAEHGKLIFEYCGLAGIALCLWAAEAANAEDARAAATS